MSRSCRPILLLLLCALLAQWGAAQQPYSLSYTTANGLPNNTVYDLLIAKEGFLYLGTEAGLVRYDGHHFRSIPYTDSRSISITGLSQDVYGRVWGQNFANELFYLENDSLRPFRPLPENASESIYRYQLAGDRAWVFSSKAMYLFDLGSLRPISRKGWAQWAGDVGFGTFYTAIIGQDNVLAVTWLNAQGEYRLSMGDTASATGDLPLPMGRIDPLLVNGKIIGMSSIDTEKGVYRMADRSKWWSFEMAKGEQIINLKTFNETGDLWALTTKGLRRMGDEQTYFELLSVTSMVRDHEGNYWLGTLYDGVLLVPSFQDKYWSYLSDTTKVTALVAMGDGRLLAGTHKGKLLYTDSKGRLLGAWNTGFTTAIERLHIDHEGYAYSGNGYFSKEAGYVSSEKLFSVKDSRYLDDMTLLAASGLDARVYLGYQGKERRSRSPSTEYQTMKQLRQVRSRCIRYNPFDHKVWVGFADQLCLYDTSTWKMEVLNFPDQTPIIANDLAWNTGDTVWASTIQKGVVCLYRGRVLRHITGQNGLSDNFCKRIYRGDGGFWVLTASGIDFISNAGTVTNYAPLLGVEGKGISDFVVRGDTFWLGTPNGILVSRGSGYQRPGKPIFRVKYMSVGGQWTDPRSAPVLRHDQNQIAIHFDFISFLQRDRYQLRYRLPGLSNDWIYPDKSSPLTLPPLAANQYELTLQWIPRDGQGETLEEKVRFTILLPWWKTWWFMGLMALLLVFAAYYAVWQWVRVLKRRSAALVEKARLENEVKQSQLTALKAQMNPHFIFNSLNTIQYYVYQNEPEQANYFLGKFSELMRLILDSSNQDTISLKRELEMLHLYLELEKMRFLDNLHCEVEVDPQLDLDHIYIPSMLIQPYIENAFKHGLLHKKEDRRLRVCYQLAEGQRLFVQIEDNGIGLKRSAEINQSRNKNHQSFGLSANKKRLELYNEQHNDKIGFLIREKFAPDGRSLGTIVEIIIPF